MDTWFEELHFTDDGTPLWQRGDGEEIPINTLSDSYLVNVLGHLERAFYERSGREYIENWNTLRDAATSQLPILAKLEHLAYHRPIPQNNYCDATCRCDSLMEHYLQHTRRPKLKRETA